MDDQRCHFQEKNRFSAASVATSSTPPKTIQKCNFKIKICSWLQFPFKCCFKNVFEWRGTSMLICFPSSSLIAFSASVVSPHTDEFLDLLASSQSRRLDDQRASFSNLPGLRLNHRTSPSVLGHLMASNNRELDEDFFDILIKCQVRLWDFWGLICASCYWTSLRRLPGLAQRF